MAPLPKLDGVRIKEIARQYTGRRAWMVGHGQSWRQARAISLDFYEECCGHMELQPNPFRKGVYTVYAIEFSDNSAYVGLTHKGEKRLAEHTSDCKSSAYCKFQAGLAHVWRVLEQDITGVSVAGRLEVAWIKRYKETGWKVLNKSNGGEPGSAAVRITNEDIFADAKLFTRRSDWLRRSRHPHWVALAVKRGIYEECCEHMHRRWSARRGKYDFAEAAALANAASFDDLRVWKATKYAYSLRRWHPDTYAKVCGSRRER